MAIYLNTETRLSFASEPGPGGYLDYITAVTDGAVNTTLNGAHVAGSRNITVVNFGAMAVGEYITIGTTASGNMEIRKIVSTSGTTILYLDYPTGFYHATGEAVENKTPLIDTSSTLTTGPTAGQLNGLQGDSLITFLPGVYTTVEVPDLKPEILPQYFLGTNSVRNFTVAYRGKQTFTGNLPNFILLNAYPMRFSLGTITTTSTTKTLPTTLTTATTFNKGSRVITITADADNANYVNGDYIQIGGDANSPEVRQIISGTDQTANAQTWILNYPLMISRSVGLLGTGWDTVNKVVAPYTHTINQSYILDSMSWNLLLVDTDESTDTHLLRRFVGGKVNRSSISAEEGGMLMMSLDEVTFLDMVHNQNKTSATNPTAKFSAAIIDPTIEVMLASTSSSAGIGGDRPHSTGALGNATYPTNEPYYFSQGSITFMGQTFARIRNFRIEINNNNEPRYYIASNPASRGPYEIQENKREYKMTATVALPDSIMATSTSTSLFKELMNEGNYGSGMAGMAITLTFTRGTNDTITITIPSNGAGTAGLDSNGAFVLSAPHNIGEENPFQVPVEIVFRNIGVTIVDSVAVMP